MTLVQFVKVNITGAQTTGLTLNSPVQFAGIEASAGSTISYDTTNFRFNLLANNTYQLESAIDFVQMNNAGDVCGVCWYCVTGATGYIGQAANITSNATTSVFSTMGLLKHIFTPTLNSSVQVRLTRVDGGIAALGSGSDSTGGLRGCYAYVKQLSAVQGNTGFTGPTGPTGAGFPPGASTGAIMISTSSNSGGWLAAGVTGSMVISNGLVKIPSYKSPQITNQAFLIGSASTTYTPTTGTYAITVELVGAGGAGGGAPVTSASQTSVGAGGGGGGYVRKNFNLSSLTSPYTYVVGVGGTPVSGSAGNSGSSSTFLANGITLMTGAGGSGGGVRAASTTIGSVLGAPGGSAFGSNAFLVVGGSTPWALTVVGNGVTGNIQGGGGSGNSNGPSSSAKSGGVGGDGGIFITEYGLI